MVAPLTEELVFRACMLPMLVPCTGPPAAIFTCPLFFGVGESRLPPSLVPSSSSPHTCVNALVSFAAHFHHVIEQLRFRQGSVAGIFLSAGECLC